MLIPRFWLTCTVVSSVLCTLEEVVCILVWSILKGSVVVGWVNVCTLVCDTVNCSIVVNLVDDRVMVGAVAWATVDRAVVVDWVVACLLVWDTVISTLVSDAVGVEDVFCNGSKNFE